MKYLNYILPLSLTFAAMGYADTSQEEMPEQCSTQNRVMHVGVRQTEARGVGYSSGYSTLEAFGIYNRCTSFMPFIDLRGHLFNNGKYGGNVGIGGRGWLVDLHHVLGYYLYYDVRQDNRGLTPQQLGPGLELLGKRMEYRINGYFPIGNDKSERYDYKFDSFKGNQIFLRHQQRRVFTGGDAEVGAHLTQSMNYDIYAGVGPYYFSASHTSAWGGKARLLGRYRQYVSLEASYSYDHLFGSIVQGSVALNFPFGMKLKFKDKPCKPRHNLALSRAAFAPYRFEIPVVKRIHQKQKAIDPATGSPWKVWFVDNTSSSNGTFESPFSTLADAQNASAPNDMIYVFPGDGTTTGMDMGMKLQDAQKFFGSGISHHIHTTKGKMKIPAFTNRSPTITNTAGSVVTLANGDQVSGFNVLMTLSGGIGIDGTSGITSANINNNSFFGNVDYFGINILGQGDVDVVYNQLVNSVSILTTARGIQISIPNGQFMDAYISHNKVSGFHRQGIYFGPLNNPTTASAEAEIEKNTVSGFGFDGIFYPTGMSNSTVKINNNLVIDDAGVVMGGIGTSAMGAIVASVNNAPDSGTVIISGNTILTPTPTAEQYGIIAQINLPTGASFRAIVTDNTVFTGSGLDSVGINIFSRGNLCATVSGNQITSQAASGTTDLNLSTIGGSSVINVNDLSNNVAQDVRITGNVNVVQEGTCGK